MDYSIGTSLNDTLILAIIVIIAGGLIVVALLINSYLSFKKKRDYIKMEMERSFRKDEYLHWKRELKMLYISKIPIIRSIVGRKHK